MKKFGLVVVVLALVLSSSPTQAENITYADGSGTINWRGGSKDGPVVVSCQAQRNSTYLRLTNCSVDVRGEPITADEQLTIHGVQGAAVINQLDAMVGLGSGTVGGPLLPDGATRGWWLRLSGYVPTTTTYVVFTAESHNTNDTMTSTYNNGVLRFFDSIP